MDNRNNACNKPNFHLSNLENEVNFVFQVILFKYPRTLDCLSSFPLIMIIIKSTSSTHILKYYFKSLAILQPLYN